MLYMQWDFIQYVMFFFVISLLSKSIRYVYALKQKYFLLKYNNQLKKLYCWNLTLEIWSIFMQVIWIENDEIRSKFYCLPNKLKFTIVPYLTIFIGCQIYQVTIYLKFDTNSIYIDYKCI